MTKLVKIDQNLLKQARALTGSNTLQTTKSNYVKISYDEDLAPKGNFVLKLWDSEKEAFNDTDLGKEMVGVVLLRTMKCSQWDNDLGSNLYDSNEFDDYQEEVFLKDNNQKEIASGTYRQLKTKYPDLKLQHILYLKINDSVAKLFIKGGGIFDFADYDNSLTEAGSALQAVETHFTTRQEKNGAVKYYVIEYKAGKTVDLKEMIGLAMSVRLDIESFKTKEQQTRSEKTAEQVFLEEPKAPDFNEDKTLNDLPWEK